MKQYRFKENRISEISSNIGLSIFLLGSISMVVIPIISLFLNNVDSVYGLVSFLLSLPIAIPFVLVSFIFSKSDKFTSEFIKEIEQDLLEASTLESLYVVRNKLWYEAVDESGMIRLSSPGTIKKLMEEIEYKIDILKKQP